MATEVMGSPECRICAQNVGAAEVPGGFLFQDDLWLVRHSAPPYGVAGWLTVQSRRHVAEPADFNDAEARNFGPMLRHFEGLLREITGALRIYTAALGESSPHLHCHMVPRYPETPSGVKAWGVFDLSRQAAAGTVHVDAGEVERICEAFRARAASGVPPLDG